MALPMSRIQLVLVLLVAAAAALLFVPTDVLAVSADVPTDGKRSLPNAVTTLAGMTPNITSRGAGINGNLNVRATLGLYQNPRPQDGKPGVPVCSAREFIQAHNKVRVGVGEPPLKWDKDLARYARRFASKRAADCKMIHSYGPYGENIFWGAQAEWSPSQVVDFWADESKFYNVTNNSCAEGQMCGHYTQIVWRDSARVGCAWVVCLNGGMYAICTYDPPGNYVNENPFSSYVDQ